MTAGLIEYEVIDHFQQLTNDRRASIQYRGDTAFCISAHSRIDTARYPAIMHHAADTEGSLVCPDNTLQNFLLQWDGPNSSLRQPYPFDDHHLHLYTHPSTDPTLHPKRHPDPISRFATVHFPDRQTDTHTDRHVDGLGDSSMNKVDH